MSRLRWAPSVTTAPQAAARAPADWYEARRVSPRFLIQEYEKKEIANRVNGRVLEKFEVGDTISMQYRQNLNNPKEKPILIEVIFPMLAVFLIHVDIQPFFVIFCVQGVVISIRQRGLGSTFTIINKFGEHVVERSYPLFSPFIKSVIVLSSRYVRRSKLYYMKSLISSE
jgi:ribosomal protein L19